MADLAYMYMEPTLILKGADSIDLKNITANSETVDSGNQRQEQNGKEPVLLRLLPSYFVYYYVYLLRLLRAMSFLCSHVTALFRDRDKKQDGKVPAAHFRVRDKKQNEKVPAGVGLPRLFRELFHRSTRAMSFLYSHLTTRFRDQDKKQVQQTTSQEIGHSSANVSREQNEGKASSVSRSHQAVKYETVAAHSRLPVKSSPLYQVTPEHFQSYKSSLYSDTVNLPASPNIGRETEPQRLSSSRHSLVEGGTV
ncbi:hypothetical protein OS493_039240 [Desmophyllum pertusum]|uniref:Uncharacterized protein n=1 Tax=Desmophyllum pertusum TaxID=174260 RepID=A0A9X0D000_9CNID|nr:hypothetical protein OS493_039240 [Desmophyllum pertusum]